jgi:multidrug efflux pump subunit AcrB
VLKAASAEAIAELSTLEGVTNVHDNLPYGKEQWIFELTTEGRSLGLTTASVGQQLRAAYDGQRIQIFHQDQNELEVRLILPEWERTDLASLGQFPIKTPGGEMIPLRSVATWEGKRGFDVIRHHDGLRTIEVSGNVDINKISGSEVVKYFTTELKDRLSAKYGITTGLDGMSLAEQEETANFAFRYVIALCLIYIVLAWIFSSYTWPLAVMAAIPLGLTGALLGHFVMGMVIGPMSMLGLFTLTGIIVNDSIILVSAYQHLLKEGIAPNQAIEEAVCSRLRAVILTSVTTVAGLFPLMLEQAPMAAAFTPLAAAICFGMLYGTLLVLLVVPALLSSMITITEWFHLKRTRTYGPVEQTA